MDNHTYGEIFQREAPRSTRPSRSSAQSRRSYNENLIAPSIGEKDDGDANASSFPCTTFMRDADRKSTRLNSSHSGESRMPSSA